MAVTYLIFAIVCIGIVFRIIQMIRKKKYADLFSALFMIPFLGFFISVVYFGGSAFNDAANSYPLYQPEHYYLFSHGNYTEVSHGIFLYLQIIEVIGIISFVIGFILSFIRAFRYNDQ